jgi:hypothetical protein
MWRAFFLAIGMFALILGGECLVIEKAVLHATEKVPTTWPIPPREKQKEVAPPEWAPWTLLCFGAVTMLYSFTLPRRSAAK